MKICLASILVILTAIGCNGKSNQETKAGLSEVQGLPDAVEENVTDTSTWVSWRGPNRNGIAVDQSPLVEFGEDDILWKAKIEGQGHSTPIFINDRIFLPTADKVKETQSVMCFNRETGEEIWNKVVHEGGLTKQIHIQNSHASHSIACDGKAIFCLFINEGQVQLTKFDFDGEQIWQKTLGRFRSDFNFGAGASPIFWKDKLIVSSESATDPFILALNPEDGEEIWRIDRAKNTSYSTPVVGNVAGKFQLLTCGSETAKGYDPETGKELWAVPTKWKVCCGTMVWHNDMVFVSGGWPASQTLGIKADGSAEIVWENPAKCYESSLINVDGYIYGLTENGVCNCWNAETGEQMWKKRMKANVAASPVLAGGNIYFTTKDGTCFVVKPNPNEYELVTTNQFGGSVYATPVFVDNLIYARVGIGAHSAREEWLYCIGKKGD